jgi:putative FmdB family regulatory protein
MPLFEYRCSDCGTSYEILHKSKEREEDIHCPACASAAHVRKLSVFAASVSSRESGGGSCASGMCDMPSAGGCASGLCGLN